MSNLHEGKIALITGALRQSLLAAIANDPALTGYGADNLMISATHTHQGPAGPADPRRTPDRPARRPAATHPLDRPIPLITDRALRTGRFRRPTATHPRPAGPADPRLRTLRTNRPR